MWWGPEPVSSFTHGSQVCQTVEKFPSKNTITFLGPVAASINVFQSQGATVLPF